MLNITNSTNGTPKPDKVRTFQTYQAWKKAVKALNPQASFTGDKDIDGSYTKGLYDAEWDGAHGEIWFPKTSHSDNVSKANGKENCGDMVEDQAKDSSLVNIAARV